MHRREALMTAGAVAGAVAVAGCIGSDDDEDPLEDSFLESVEFDGYEMQISVDDDDIDEIVITDSDDEETVSLSVSGGSATHDINFIPDDTYTFTGLSGGEEVESVEYEMHPELNFIEAERIGGATVDLDDEPPVDTGDREDFWLPRFNMEVEVENTGNAPISIYRERVHVEEPAPQQPISDVWTHPGIDETSDHLRGVIIEPGETKTFDTYDSTIELQGPFVIYGEEEDAHGWVGDPIETTLLLQDERGDGQRADVEINYEGLHLAREETWYRGRWSWETIEIDLLD